MSIHLHGSWLVLIGNVQINYGVICISCYLFSYLLDGKCWNLTLKLTLIISSDYFDD